MKTALFLSALLFTTALSNAAFAQPVSSHGTATQTTTVGGPAGSYTQSETVKTENGVVVDHDVSAAGDPSVAVAVDSDISADVPIAVPGAIPDLAVLPTAPAAVATETTTEIIHDSTPPVAIMPPMVPAVVPAVPGTLPGVSGVTHSESTTTTQRIQGDDGEHVITNQTHTEQKSQ